jgi:hypothetical protein
MLALDVTIAELPLLRADWVFHLCLLGGSARWSLCRVMYVAALEGPLGPREKRQAQVSCLGYGLRVLAWARMQAVALG